MVQLPHESFAASSNLEHRQRTDEIAARHSVHRQADINPRCHVEDVQLPPLHGCKPTRHMRSRLALWKNDLQRDVEGCKRMPERG